MQPEVAFAELTFRPLRRVLSFPPRHELLRDAIRFCTSVWGGAYHLLAIEQEDGNWDTRTAEYVDSAHPDFVTYLDDRNATHSARHPWLLTQPLRELRLAGDARPLWLSTPFLGAPMGALPPDERLPLWIAATWGDTSPSAFGFPLTPPMDVPDDRAWVPHPRIAIEHWTRDSGSAIANTVQGISVARGSLAPFFSFVFVGIPEAGHIESLATFWNLRALLWPQGGRIAPLPLWVSAEAVDDLPNRLRAAAARIVNYSTPDALVFCPWLERPDVRDRSARLLGAEYLEGDEATLSFAPRGERPVTFRIGEPDLPEHNGLRVAMTQEVPIRRGSLIALPVRLPPPVDQCHGVVAVEIGSLADVVVPPSAAAAQLLRPDARPAESGISISMRAQETHELTVRVVRDEDMILAFMTERGLEATPSSAVEPVSRMLTFVGGFEALKVLRSEAALRVLEALAPPRSENLEKLLESVPHEQRELLVGIYPQPSRSLAQLTQRAALTRDGISAALSNLVHAGVVLPGLLIRCPDCGYRSWRIVDEVSVDMTCRGCRRVFRVMLREGRNSLEPEWHYALNEAFAWPIDQGAIPTLLAMAQMKSKARLSFRAIPGVYLAERQQEVDTVALIDGGAVVLEAKTGALLTESEVDRTLEIAETLDGEAWFVTLRDWNEDTREMVYARAEPHANLPITLLSRSDLLLGRQTSNQ